LASRINQDPKIGKAKGYPVSASDPVGLANVFSSIRKDLGNPTVGVRNPGGGFSMTHFRDSKVEQLDSAYETHVKGGFLFSQAMIEAIESQDALLLLSELLSYGVWIFSQYQKLKIYAPNAAVSDQISSVSFRMS